MRCKNKEISKSEFVAKTKFLSDCLSKYPGVLFIQIPWSTFYPNTLEYCLSKYPGVLFIQIPWSTFYPNTLEYFLSKYPGVLFTQIPWSTVYPNTLEYFLPKYPGVLFIQIPWSTFHFCELLMSILSFIIMYYVLFCIPFREFNSLIAN